MGVFMDRSADPFRARSSAPGELGGLLSGEWGVWTVGSCGNSNLDNSVWERNKELTEVFSQDYNQHHRKSYHSHRHLPTGTFHLLLAHCNAGCAEGLFLPVSILRLGLSPVTLPLAELVLLSAAAKPVANKSSRNPS